MKWYEENGKHLGFDDDTYVYRVLDEESFDPEEAFMILADIEYERMREERMGW